MCKPEVFNPEVQKIFILRFQKIADEKNNNNKTEHKQ